ncbi:hypothetical protein CW731_05765 [Polaribacter sp. ALD11]|uniref:hypothetical protein n=1 Tax=Polaribacter sp. ALD11 TaxID=2058137 RepID=UPI000C30E0BD|nr:hypothetical protein [Polaribacter sp. ALD11]AUC84829.1 hypothetical protein CW731_05765 [Polaribacter sp. ALD11]
MKNIITLLFMLVLITSCGNKKIEKLNNKISELEKLNKILLDSLSNKTYNRLINSNLWGISEKNDLIINKPNKFKFVFSSIQKLPKYNIYAVTKKGGKKSSTLIYENYTESEFEYDFIPENKKDNSFQIQALFALDSILIEIPGKITMPIK